MRFIIVIPYNGLLTGYIKNLHTFGKCGGQIAISFIKH